MRPIAFCSDYGLADPFAGVCHAVMARLAPDARVVDITHGIGAQDVAAGAAVLADAAPQLAGWVLLAVVDPGVGTSRRALALAAGETLLIGPDNGLLLEAADVLGGVIGAWSLPGAKPPPGQGATFDGRDVFAPAAARLAAGAEPDQLGEALDVATLTRLPTPSTEIGHGTIRTAVRRIDGYGNVQLHAHGTALEQAGIRKGKRVRVRVAATLTEAVVCDAFAELEPAGLGLLPDAFGRVQLCVRDGSVNNLLHVTSATPVRITADWAGRGPPA